MAKKSKKLKKSSDQYFKVVTAEGTDSADIFLYGYIGQDYWWDDELKEQTITDLEFVKTLRRLEKKYSTINIRINSPGGSMLHGNAIISAIRNSKAEIHGWNDGLAASMAGDIWIACPHRHMAKNALLMIHAAIGFVWGNAKEMRNEADLLDKWSQTQAVITEEALDMTLEEINERFYDYEDHWLTAAEVEELGLISEAEEYEAEGEMGDNTSKLSFHDIIKRFADQGDDLAKKCLQGLEKMGERFKQSITQNQPTIVNHQTTTDMKIEDLKKSIANGELKIEDLTKELEEQGFEVKKTEKPTEEKKEEVDISSAITKAVEAATKPLLEKIENLEGEVKKFGDEPGNTITNVLPNLDALKLSPEQLQYKKQLDDINKTFVEIGQSGIVTFT